MTAAGSPRPPRVRYLPQPDWQPQFWHWQVSHWQVQGEHCLQEPQFVFEFPQQLPAA